MTGSTAEVAFVVVAACILLNHACIYSYCTLSKKLINIGDNRYLMYIAMYIHIARCEIVSTEAIYNSNIV